MSEEIPDHLLGTPQHPRARDLSQFVVHLTPREEDLANILLTGKLEARKPHGLTKGLFMVEKNHKSCCLSEMPLTELERLSRFGRYGIAFRKDWVREQGGQRVWYLDDGSDQLDAVRGIVNGLVEERAWEDAFWKLTPFIDEVTPGRYAWEHEREWRVVGDLEFSWQDIALVIAPDGSDLGFDEEPNLGTAVYDHHSDEVVWWGGPVPAVSAAINLFAQQFHDEWVSADDAGVPYDSAEGGYQADVEDTWDAVETSFEHLPEHVREAIRERLSGSGGPWVSRADAERDALEAQEDDAEYMRAHFPPWDPSTPPELRQ